MLVKVFFDKVGIGPMHEHYHSQVGYIESGSFDVAIDGKIKTLTGGNTFYIPSHALHGAICTKAGVLIDVFSPIYEYFMKS